MSLNSKLILQAEFNPKIKTYILIVVAFFMFISILGIPLLIIWFFGLGQYISKQFFESLECKITNQHLMFCKGVLFKIEKTIPLENIQDLTFIENPLLTRLGLKILKIETAGQSNPKSSDMKLIGIIKSYDFKEKILEQRDLINSMSTSKTHLSDFENSESVNLLMEIRDILNEIKTNRKG